MPQRQQATFTLFCGLPGAGKTTLAKRLESQGEGIRICTDDWQEDLHLQHIQDNVRSQLQAQLYRLALDILAHGQNVILEDGLWTKRERQEKLADARKRGVHVELHFFDLTFDELWRRLDARNQDLPHGAVHIPKQDLFTCWNAFERPTPEELNTFDNVHKYADID